MDWAAQFAEHWGAYVERARERIEMMKAGTLGTFEITPTGKKLDTTQQSIEDTQAEIERLVPLIEKARAGKL